MTNQEAVKALGKVSETLTEEAGRAYEAGQDHYGKALEMVEQMVVEQINFLAALI